MLQRMRLQTWGDKGLSTWNHGNEAGQRCRGAQERGLLCIGDSETVGIQA